MKKKGGVCAGGCWSAGKRRTRRIRGGMYGFQGGVITNGTLEAGAVDTSSPVDSATGATMPDPYDVKMGGRRRRKTRKGKSRKGRKGTRKMRGGAGQISAMKAGYGFTGQGVGGLADATPAPTSGGNAF